MRPTQRRKVIDDGHFPPHSGVNHAGDPWRGTKRYDRAERRRRNRRTWAAIKADARRAYLESKRAAA